MNTQKLLSIFLSAALTFSFAGQTSNKKLPSAAAIGRGYAEYYSDYPIITTTERCAGIKTPPAKRVYSTFEHMSDLDLSGLVIYVDEDVYTRVDAISAYSQITRHEYEIGSIDDDCIDFGSNDCDLYFFNDPTYGEPPYYVENDKYYVTLIDRDGDLRFSEPDTPDVIHDVKNTYDVSFVIYTDDPKRKSRFIQIDNKEITAYTCAEKICIKDMGDFTADRKTYNYMDYEIDESIIEGDIVSGALSVDPDTNYVEFGDLYVVKPALGNGDANCDGTVDMSDVVLVMQSLSNPNRYGLEGTEDTRISGRGLRLADLNGEGVTVQDAQLIQEKLLGLE